MLVGGVLLAWRRSDRDALILLAGGLFSLGLLPTMLSRADASHIVPGSVAALALLPAAAALLLRRVRGGGSSLRLAGCTAGLFLCAMCVAVVALGGSGSLTALRTPAFTQAFDVRVGDRSFPVADPAEAASVQVVAQALARRSRSGQSLFVGPSDLRFTNYDDTYIYYLLPKLRPASFYMELNPQTANLPGSGLASDIRNTDWLILTSRYEGLEPNSSQRPGSPLPNQVVRRDFCLRLSSGQYALLQRCR